MKILLGWLQDFVDLSSVPVPELIARLTESTVEIGHTEVLFTPLQHIVTAKIIKKTPHPSVEKLSVCIADTGSRQYEVVCGAPNAQEGVITAFADIGVKLADGTVLQRKEICGHHSHGMLLSEKELDIGNDHSGIIVFPEDTPLGRSISEVLGIQPEVMLEIDNNSITHRPDLWGIYGIARECAALFNLPFKPLDTQEWRERILSYFSEEKPPVSISVKTPDCLSYAGFSVNGVDARRKSNWKIAHRLRASGMNPVNAVVDISNYVMLETGIPNHFFDRRKINSNRLQVQNCGEDQDFITLDGEKRRLQKEDIVVCSGDQPLAIAGIMGGENSAIDPDTTEIFIEGAVWPVQNVRRTSVRLGLRTDASMRYEKSLDPESVEFMLGRCADLLKEYFPDCKFIGQIQQGRNPDWSAYEIIFDIRRAAALLSMDIDMQQAKNIFSLLGFHWEPGNDEYTIKVYPPSWRSTRDPMVHADLIEEIARIRGFKHIHTRAPVWPLLPKNMPLYVSLRRSVQDFLVLHGRAFEIMTHPLIGKKLLSRADWDIDNEDLALTHALSPERDRLRPSLLPSFLEALELNQKYFESFRFFEYGRTARTLEQEHTHTACLFYDRQNSPFISAADILEEMLDYLHINAELISSPMNNPLLPENWKGAHPYELLHIQSEGNIIGYVVSLHPLFLRKRKIKGFVSLFEIDLTPWLEKERPHQYRYQTPMRFQESILDFTVLATHGEEVHRIIACLPVGDPAHHIVDAKILTVFPLPDALKAVTVRVRLNSDERTLTHEDLKASEQFIVQTLADNGWDLKT